MPEVEVAVNETTRDLEALLRCGLAFSSGEVVERDDADCGLADGGLADAGVARYAGFERSAHFFSELRVFIVKRLAGVRSLGRLRSFTPLPLHSHSKRLGCVFDQLPQEATTRTDCVGS